MEGNTGAVGVDHNGNTAPDSRRRNGFASLVIFDMEATGLKRRPRVTELCMLAVQTNEIKSANLGFPRVINKLQLCFNPESVIDIGASHITGLYNDALEHMAKFKEQTALISGFLASLPQPVCLIAHNGHRYDFPLLLAELRNANHTLSARAEVWCADSFEAFRVLDGLPAIPDWLVQKDKEKQVKTTGSGSNTLVENGTSSKETSTEEQGGGAVGADSLSVKKEGVRGPPGVLDTTSPSKRRAKCINGSEDSSVSLSKHAKTIDLPAFDSQLSVTDSELLEAYDDILPEESTIVAATSSSVDVVGETQQTEQETTPAKDTGQVSSIVANGVGQFSKKQQPLHVASLERQKVARRLFEERNSQAKAVMSLAPGGHGDDAHTGSSHPLKDQSKSKDEIKHSSGNNASITPDTHPEFCSDSSISNGQAVGNTSPTAESSVSSSESRVLSSACTGPPNAKTVSNASPASGQKVSYKLTEIYKRAFGRYPTVAHTAADDCVTLLNVIINRSSQFMTFVEENAVHLDTFEPMF